MASARRLWSFPQTPTETTEEEAEEEAAEEEGADASEEESTEEEDTEEEAADGSEEEAEESAEEEAMVEAAETATYTAGVTVTAAGYKVTFVYENTDDSVVSVQVAGNMNFYSEEDVAAFAEAGYPSDGGGITPKTAYEYESGMCTAMANAPVSNRL